MRCHNGETTVYKTNKWLLSTKQLNSAFWFIVESLHFNLINKTNLLWWVKHLYSYREDLSLCLLQKAQRSATLAFPHPVYNIRLSKATESRMQKKSMHSTINKIVQRKNNNFLKSHSSGFGIYTHIKSFYLFIYICIRMIIKNKRYISAVYKVIQMLSSVVHVTSILRMGKQLIKLLGLCVEIILTVCLVSGEQGDGKKEWVWGPCWTNIHISPQ